MNYIKKENKKAFEFFTNAGYKLEKASQLTYNDYYYNRVGAGWLTEDDVDEHPCFDEYVSLCAISHIYIVTNWEGREGIKSFHKFMEQRNLLLPKYYHAFKKFNEEQTIISDELKEALLEILMKDSYLFDCEIFLLVEGSHTIISVHDTKTNTSTKYIAEGISFTVNNMNDENIDVFTFVKNNNDLKLLKYEI